ncbi:MAG TPA: hypothetical protein VMU93_16775 [Caulobacteraceae bacterium]|nr:hypothetical protein [Caulobacteraceae bacterium]
MTRAEKLTRIMRKWIDVAGEAVAVCTDPAPKSPEMVQMILGDLDWMQADIKRIEGSRTFPPEARHLAAQVFAKLGEARRALGRRYGQ